MKIECWCHDWKFLDSQNKLMISVRIWPGLSEIWLCFFLAVPPFATTYTGKCRAAIYLCFYILGLQMFLICRTKHSIPFIRIRYAKEKIQEMKTSLALLSGEKIHRVYTDPVERLEHLYMYVSDSILSLLVPRKMTISGDEGNPTFNPKIFHPKTVTT